MKNGRPEPLGASLDAGGLNIAVVSSNAHAIAVSLFDQEDRETARLPLPARTGDVFHGHIPGIGAGTRYGLRAFGPWAPVRGHLFNPAKLLVDPYATRLDRPFRLHPSLFDAAEPNPIDTATWMPKAIVEAPLPALPERPPFDWNRQVIQELHVRGFTMRHPDVPPEQRGTFAGLGHPAVIAHLTELGITAVEMLPSAAWIDEPHLPPLGLTNYWGYNPVAFLAPDPRLAPGGWTEIRATVAALRAAGIAVILDVVLNHTGEGDAHGPTLSLRGLDDALYYRRAADDTSRYVNDTGCGHTLALDCPPVWRLAQDALRAWALRGDIDGFRLDLATTLGRSATGFNPAAPLLAAIAADPVLASRAIIAEPWDIGPGGYQLGAFPAAWGEWNDRYRDTVRRFWRGDPGCLGDLAARFAGSADIFAPRHRPISRSINFITAHDGFTLTDLVSYAGKHNLANGESNRDGTDENFSWNSGTEGPTDDPAIIAARRRDRRALLATLLLSRGTPMLAMGDPCGHGQNGNNNAYAQDNPIAWIDWGEAMDREHAAFTARLIALRQSSPCLHESGPLTGGVTDETMIPDVTWFSHAGTSMTEADWRDQERRTLIAMLHSASPEPDTVLVILHAGILDIEICLPLAPPRCRWRVAIDSATPMRDESPESVTKVAARSVLLLRAEPAPVTAHRSGVSDSELDQLAGRAGVSTVWWDIAGHEHRTSNDTKQALLTALGLPAATRDDLRQSLNRLTGPRPLPSALTAMEGQPFHVRVGQSVRPAWVTLRTEENALLRFTVDDGLVSIPPLPPGRHLLMVDDDPDTRCHLTVAPSRCFLPEDLASGGRRFGIAAHLYTLRGQTDQGIGDFTTLTELITSAARAGAAVVGLNPLHALFPGDRSRASPYHPSHRAFLDPIYIDVSSFPGSDPAGFAALSTPGLVDYPGVWDAKHQALRTAFAAAGGNDPRLDDFIAAGGIALRDFARFETISTSIGHTNWRAWPDCLRHPTSPSVSAFAEAHANQIRFICYQQWIADQQLGNAASLAQSSGLTIGLYRDLAIGCAPDGAESWAYQDVLMSGVSVGAPPDPFSITGQVWGLPPFNPLALARDGFAGFSGLLAANMRHAGALRIDHVMGLRRLFLVPAGADASQGTYLDFPFEDLLGQLTLASARARCLVVGEDLGTVPDGMRERLNAAQVLSYRVLWFEKDGAAFRPPASWPVLAAACVSTHDLPTSRGWWEGADIAEQAALGRLDPATAQAERNEEKAALITLAQYEGLIEGGETLENKDALDFTLHSLIAVTPCVIALAQADDLAGEATAVNLPGTDRERPNWRRRLRIPASELCDGPHAASVLTGFRSRATAMNGTGSGPLTHPFSSTNEPEIPPS